MRAPHAIEPVLQNEGNDVIIAGQVLAEEATAHRECIRSVHNNGIQRRISNGLQIQVGHRKRVALVRSDVEAAITLLQCEALLVITGNYSFDVIYSVPAARNL